MNYLFWNVNKKNNDEIIKFLIHAYEPDIVAFSEYEGNIKNLLILLDNIGMYYYSVPQIACERINIISRYKPKEINHFTDNRYYTIKSFPYHKKKQLVTFLHFPSKLHADATTYMLHSTELKNDILVDKNRSGISDIVIMGDFNMNPHEPAMLSSQGLHAISSKEIVARCGKRIVGGREYEMLYNPMWNMFGDINEPTGTYFYQTANAVCYFWNVFDQVIISPSLVNNFKHDKLKIITEINDIQLKDDKGKPRKEISDHFPLFFSID